ncbi:MAG: alpha/beta fold hydrolase [Propionibacteriales bacterium]|nr:alpha/beta fold hydrolase [Propionibacteriales bacterium]
METAHVDGLQVAYTRHGDGPPLVLLHGGLSDSRSWRRQRALADEFTLLAWDAPGCGLSAVPPSTWRIADYADCLAGWLGSIGVERAHVLGLSWGSSLALELCHRHPAFVRSLVLASAYAGWAGSLPPEEVRARIEGFLDLVGQSPAAVIDAVLPTLVTPAAPPGSAEEIAAMIADFHPAGATTMLLAMAEADLRPALPRIAVPTLLLYGELDQRSPLPVARALHEQIAGSTLVVLPGVGHECGVEDADGFNAAVRSFLQSTPR